MRISETPSPIDFASPGFPIARRSILARTRARARRSASRSSQCAKCSVFRISIIHYSVACGIQAVNAWVPIFYRYVATQRIHHTVFRSSHFQWEHVATDWVGRSLRERRGGHGPAYALRADLKQGVFVLFVGASLLSRRRPCEGGCEDRAQSTHAVRASAYATLRRDKSADPTSLQGAAPTAPPFSQPNATAGSPANNPTHGRTRSRRGAPSCFSSAVDPPSKTSRCRVK